MEPFSKHTGVGVPLRRSNVDTDQIIPAVYLKRVTRTGFEDGLFAAWRGDESFVLNQEPFRNGSVLVAGKRLIHPQLQTLYLAALALRRSLDDGYLPPSHTLRHLARLTVRDAEGGVWLIEPSTGRFLRQEVADPHTFEPAELPDPLSPDSSPAEAGTR